MSKLIFITGPVRSGKSNFAVNLAKKSKKKIIFIATCKPVDTEMKERIKKHQQQRPKEWITIEEEIDLGSVLRKISKDKLIIIDCITLWVSNLFFHNFNEKEILKIVNGLISIIKRKGLSVIIVSNEVGWGIVPNNKIARNFRDIMGIIHQKISESSNEIYLLVSGIPIKLK
jgi:adenosylcobinamide kinase/adenosylcobinamide-phosphate guanylyltransferase